MTFSLATSQAHGVALAWRWRGLVRNRLTPWNIPSVVSHSIFSMYFLTYIKAVVLVAEAMPRPGSMSIRTSSSGSRLAPRLSRLEFDGDPPGVSTAVARMLGIGKTTHRRIEGTLFEPTPVRETVTFAFAVDG